MKNFNISGVHWKIRLLGGEGVTKKQYRGGELPKKGGLGQFADLRDGLGQFANLRGAWQERGGGVFERGLIPQCPLWHLCNLLLIVCEHWGHL